MKIATEMTADSRALYERLSKCTVGATVTYKELGGIVRRDVQDDRYILSTAIRNCLRDGKVFGVVRGEGVKLLSDGEIVADAESIPQRIRRLSRRASRKLAAVHDFGNLTNEQKVKHNTLMSLFGAITAFGRSSNIAKIESEVKRTSQSLSLNATLEVFSND